MPTCILLLLAALLGAADATVAKTLDRFAAADWAVSEWGPAHGAMRREGDQLELAATFAAGVFQWSGLRPLHPLATPGETRRVSLEFAADPAFQVQLAFSDGWGRAKVDGKDLKIAWDPAGDWEVRDFDIPRGWVQPVQVTGVTLHNSAKRKSGGPCTLRLRRLAVILDTAGVDAATGARAGWQPPPDKPDLAPPRVPLCGLRLVPTAQAGVFAGEPPAFAVALDSWLPGTRSGTLAWRTSDDDGTAIASGTVPVAVEDRLAVALAPVAPRFGVHRLAVSVELAGAPVLAAEAAFAVLPPPLALTAAEHAASPYGLCVHGGRSRLPDAFARAGIRWFRDYCFDWQWTERSEGADKTFAGWPDHRRIAADYRSRGLGLLPVLRGAIPRPAKDAVPGPLPEPGPGFAAHLADLVHAFPELTWWELDNEYDLGCAGFERASGWEHYRTWHRCFAAALHGLGGGLRAVENGRAGIYPDLLRAAVASGDFAGIDVANVHHYCGADPPERNVANCNTAVEGEGEPTLFADRLRDTVAAAGSDGRPRQVWLSEFGWDDLAGPRVPTAAKTAWLPRGFIAAFSAGIARAFWFYDLSHTPAEARRFFDGCGLIGGTGGPEPALAAYAGLTQVLPAPAWVGPVEGDGIAGGVLRSRGVLVAALWSADGRPHRLRVEAEALRDVFANPLSAGEVVLGEAPVYAVGIPADGALARQAAYEIASHRYVRVCAGDPLTVRLRGPGRGAELLPQVPAGWTAEAGADRDGGGEVRVTVPLTAALGEATVRISCREDGAEVASRSLVVQVVPPLAVEPPRLVGPPGATTLQVAVRNRSLTARPATLAVEAPAAWVAPAAASDLGTLAPGEQRTVAVPLTWAIPAPAGSAAVALRAPGCTDQRASIVAPLRRLPRADRIVIDGDLGDWGADGLRGDGAYGGDVPGGAEVGVAWHADGLYLAARVADGGRQTASPRTFWMQDALEVFIAADGAEAKRAWRPQDLHLWLVPQPEAGRVFVGRWQHGKANPETAYDLPGIVSAARRDGNGYRLECLIPAALIPGWAPRPGARLAAAIVLGVEARGGRRELWWPLPKADGLAWQPGLWGGWILDP